MGVAIVVIHFAGYDVRGNVLIARLQKHLSRFQLTTYL